MSLLVILALLSGLVLGQRFEVVTLISTSLVTIVLAIGVEAGRGGTLLRACVAAAVAILCLQFGYLLGLGVRQLMSLPRASRRRCFDDNSLTPRRPRIESFFQRVVT